MTPRNRKRCHSRATAKGRYLSAPLGIPQSTNLAPTPGGGVGLSNPRIFDDFFPKLGLIASISSQVPKNMRLIPHISTHYHTYRIPNSIPRNCQQMGMSQNHSTNPPFPLLPQFLNPRAPASPGMPHSPTSTVKIPFFGLSIPLQSQKMAVFHRNPNTYIHRSPYIPLMFPYINCSHKSHSHIRHSRHQIRMKHIWTQYGKS